MPNRTGKRTKSVMKAAHFIGYSKTINSQVVSVLMEDVNSDVLFCTGTVTVTGGGSGYAKGCLYIKTDVTTGTPAMYENIGTKTSCNFYLIDASVADVTAFTGLSDVPSAYTASGNFLVKVNNAASALEFVALSGNGTISATGVLSVTGLTMASQAVGDMFYASSASALARLPKGTAAQIMAMNSGAAAPEWVSVSGNVTMAVGGGMSVTGLTVASQAAGDLFYAASASTLARLGKGSSGQFLRMDAGATNPNWTSLSGDISVDPSGSVVLANGLVQTVEFALTKTSILAMNGAPVVVVSGGAGKVVEFLGACIIFDHDTGANYGGGGDVTINEESGSAVSTLVSAANSFAAAGDTLSILKPIEATYTPVSGKGLTITNGTGAFTDGGVSNGVGRIRVSYRVHSTGL